MQHGGQRSSRAVVAQQHSLTHRHAHTPDMTLNATLSKRRGSNRVKPPRLVAPRPVVRLWLRAPCRAALWLGPVGITCCVPPRRAVRITAVDSRRQLPHPAPGRGVGSAAASLRARCA
eukprot:scaffold1547_cov151-Isochrysis_galbana.AAC.3